MDGSVETAVSQLMKWFCFPQICGETNGRYLGFFPFLSRRVG